jgi:baseplate J-like protein
LSDQGFVSVPITTEGQTLADDAVERLRDQWDGWEPNDGDLEVVQIEALAPMAQNAAEAASRMFPAAFRQFGTALYGVPYQDGLPAEGTVTFTIIDDVGGYVIPAGSTIDIDGYAFAVDVAQTVAPTVTTLTGVGVTATENGSAQNGLVGASVTPISSLAFVESVSLDSPTGGGADAENDALYQDRFAAELQLRAKTLVTTRDFEVEAMADPGVGRAVAIADSARHITVVLIDDFGEPVDTAVKDRLVELFADYRQVNTIVTVIDATYTTVSVTYSVVAYPGFDPIDLAARIDETLAATLSPANWGRPSNFGDPGSPDAWYNEPVVRKNKIIDLIADVEGVNYVVDVTITGSAGTVDGAGDLTMPGSVALPRPGTMAGTVA